MINDSSGKEHMFVFKPSLILYLTYSEGFKALSVGKPILAKTKLLGNSAEYWYHLKEN